MKKPWIVAALALAIALAGCQRAERAADLAALAPKADKPKLGAADDVKKLLACCDENARAMGAECCNQLQELMMTRAAAKGTDGNPSMPANAGGPAFKTGRPVTIEPAIAARWPKVKLRVGPKSGAGRELVIAVGQKAQIDGTPLEIEAVAFAPAFKMTADAIVSDGAEPTNPAAKVTIREAGKPDWTGWLFAKMPDVHAYPSDAWKATLVEGMGN